MTRTESKFAIDLLEREKARRLEKGIPLLDRSSDQELTRMLDGKPPTVKYQILNLLEENPQGLTFREISKALKVSKYKESTYRSSLTKLRREGTIKAQKSDIRAANRMKVNIYKMATTDANLNNLGDNK